MSSRPDAPLSVERRQAAAGEPVVFVVSGDLVVTTRDVLRDALRESIERGARDIVLDLRRISHVDTPGLALLYRLHELCAGAGGSLTVAGLPERFAELIRHLRLDGEMRFRGDPESTGDSTR